MGSARARLSGHVIIREGESASTANAIQHGGERTACLSVLAHLCSAIPWKQSFILPSLYACLFYLQNQHRDVREWVAHHLAVGARSACQACCASRRHDVRLEMCSGASCMTCCYATKCCCCTYMGVRLPNPPSECRGGCALLGMWR